MVDKDYTVWGQELSWICPVCGFKILDWEMHVTRSDSNYDFSICPSCESESIILDR